MRGAGIDTPSPLVRQLLRLTVTVVALGFCGALAAAPEAELWERWTAHDPASDGRIEHAAWQRFLDRYLRAVEGGVNRLAYG